MLEQVKIEGGAFTILVQEDKPIAKPSLLTAKTYQKTIAGQSVEVTEYENPNDTYAYYLYFTLSDGNDDFFFSVRSKSEDREDTDDFIERLSMQ
jgi:hypothetical protein